MHRNDVRTLLGQRHPGGRAGNHVGEVDHPYAFERPMQFEPGTNWSYAHTNFMILGHILEQIGGKPLDQLLREQVLQPMGLRNTVATTTSAIPPRSIAARRAAIATRSRSMPTNWI